MHILNKVFNSNIVLLARFVTAVDYSSTYKPTGLSFFVIFVHFLAVVHSNNTQNVLFYKVEWQQ